jgi:hypothetical protein
MSADKSKNKEQFDKMLTDGLRRYEKTLSPDFADKIVSRARLQTQQKLLAKVIWQERLALAGCIMIPVAVLAVILIFPQIIDKLSERITQLCSNISQAIISGQIEWQPFIIFTIAAAVAAYGIFELFFAEN